MNDDERDRRIETLTDAIADVNRAVGRTNRAVDATNHTVEETTRAVHATASAVHATASAVRATAGAVDETNRAVLAVAEHEATTKRDLGMLAAEVATLARVIGAHLVTDHGYPLAPSGA